MIANDKCKTNEVLRQELPNKEQSMTDRFLVNEEFIQSLDNSDGATQYD